MTLILFHFSIRPVLFGTCLLGKIRRSHVTFLRSGAVVFRRRHRAGIRVEVKNDDIKSTKALSLLVKYRNEQCSMNVNTEPEWKLTRVRVSLTPL